jgi:ketosteroid isomerase-like protein
MADSVQIVKDAYDRFSKGDIEGILSNVSENIEWNTPEIENAPFGGRRRGRSEVAEFFESLNKTEEVTKFEPREFIAEGDRVVVLGTYGATVRETGRNVDIDWVHVFRITDGKISEFAEYFDTAAASKAYQKATKAQP